MTIKKVFVALMIIISLLALQILLSRAKNKWLGIIIPVLNLIIAILFSLNQATWGDAMVYFLIMIIPLVVNIGIYLNCRSKLKGKNNSELIKMKIEDLN